MTENTDLVHKLDAYHVPLIMEELHAAIGGKLVSFIGHASGVLITDMFGRQTIEPNTTKTVRVTVTPDITDDEIAAVERVIGAHDASKPHPDQEAAAALARRKAELTASLADDLAWIRALPVQLNNPGIQRLANTLADLIEFIT